MKKFDLWNRIKKMIHQEKKSPEFYDGEIWWTQFGQNISSEIYGKGDDFLRPAIVIRKVFDDACIVLPITSQEKSGSYYHRFKDRNGKWQYAYLAQVRYVDAKRFKHRFGEMKKQDFENLKQEFINFMNKNNPPR